MFIITKPHEKIPDTFFQVKKIGIRFLGQKIQAKKSRPNLLEKIKQIISIDHSTTSPWTVTDWQIKSLFLLKDCYNGYRITSKNFLSSFQTLLQQLQYHIKKVSLIFSKPVTAVTGWHEIKKFFVIFSKACYSSYRITSQKYSIIFSNAVTADTEWPENSQNQKLE